MSNIELSSSGYFADIRLKGGGLNSLTFDGRNLIEPYLDHGVNRYSGDILAPWPNRIRDGKYSYQGKNYQLEITEPARLNALHGLVNNGLWDLVSKNPTSAELSYVLQKSDQFPSSIKFQIKYELSLEGLLIEISAKNTGKNPAPYGVSIHPYLVADSQSKVDDWFLKLPAGDFFCVDEVRLLPTQVEPVPSYLDFRELQQIRDTFIDHAFLIDENLDSQRIEILSPSGYGVAMSFSKDLKWIQVHTADREGGPDSRRSLAIEPMSCPPDAFNSGIDLIHLLPNETKSSFWRIFAL